MRSVCLALVAAAVLASTQHPPVSTQHPTPGTQHPNMGGTFIAVFATRTSVLLFSDGRVVSSADGSVVRDDWPKVFRLTGQIGMLTAGRTLPNLVTGLRADIDAGGNGAPDLPAAVRNALTREWNKLSAGSGRAPEGRAVTFVSGFDDNGKARLFVYDSASRFQMTETPLLEDGSDLDVVAIATGATTNQDVSAVIIRHVDEAYRRDPSMDRRQLFLTAFNAAKAELAARNTRIGGRTFAAEIGKGTGYKEL